MKRIIWNVISILLSLLALFSIGEHFGYVQIYYPEFVANQPLHDPVNARVVGPDLLILADGRKLRLDDQQYSAEEPFEVQVALTTPLSSPNRVLVHVKDTRFFCGNCWTGMVNLPLIPTRIPKYQRTALGLASFENP